MLTPSYLLHATEPAEEIAEKLRTDTALKNKQLRDKTDKIIERARLEAKEILDDAKREADELLKEMRTIAKNDSKFERRLVSFEQAKYLFEISKNVLFSR